MMGRTSPCRTTMALVLAPVLACCIWAEAIAGTGSAWNDLQPGQRNLSWATGWFLYAAVVPTVVVVTTLLTRRGVGNHDLVGRALRIEKWGLVFALPLFVVAAMVFLGSAII
jgi:hypothetical protein